MRTIEEINARLEEIRGLLEQPDTVDLTAIQEEVESLTAERKKLQETAAAAEALRKHIAEGAGTTVENHNGEARTLKEIRNSQEYINAYAEYIKTGNENEVRSLLTKNVDGGTIPVPEFLQELIETAWENDEIMSRVNRTFIRGNLKIPFELSADGAYVHAEGTTAPTEEALTFGLVSLVPETIKK